MIQMDTSSVNRRRQPLRSRTVDTLINILSICYDNSCHIIKNTGKGTEKDVSSDINDIIPKDMLFQEQMPMDETQVVFDSQKGGLCSKLMESAEHDHNLLGEKKDLFNKVNTGHLPTDKDMTSSSPHLPTNKDVEELEVLEDLIDFMPRVDAKSVDKTDSKPKDFIGTKTGPANDNNAIRLLRESVENSGKDMAGLVNKTTRNLVDYSEIGFGSDHVLPLQSNSKIDATKNRDRVYPLKESGAQNNKKRPGSCTKEERTIKKSKKSVDSTTRPASLTLLGEQLANASQEVVDASANKDATVEKKRKRVLTKERKAKRKIKDRIKRAEKNRKLGVKRLKLQPVIKEKKITYCRHYMMGRCHEGEKCKFSHDTTPLTKSKPCCHFARHACMKGDDCPFDHDLSKYPCNNYQTKGSCNRGSDCMFSHEAQPSEAPLNASNESKPEQKPSSNSGSKIVETKSCSVPKFVDVTPKSARPPKGINFLSLEKLPQESRELDKITKTPHVIQVSKEIAKTPHVQDPKEIAKTPNAVQDTSEITKVPPVVPRGINFLSFGKKPGMGHSNDGFPFKISNGTEKPRLSDVEGESLKTTPMVNVVNEVKVDFPTDRPNSSKKPMPIMSFMSSTSQKALHSTLAFASKFDSGVKSKV
ncbi:hypothetical protein M8C21_014584 [Ambrosia artemisiifolia]|uniref:C3H1-type domain-containing protein n=1 Tax=Ambrosia artemisiifolia TaxID=4212 RepID=A0AAD5BLT8_AMBAR|nr:hypothetical protein M8C21_014584 [Ambrosia artemisiifolia]